VRVTTASGKSEDYDAVVLATHSDVSLSLLGDGASAEEAAVMRGVPYGANAVYLHTDESLMPVDKRAWASWNFLVRAE
jgi:predicted NAD/FAD-binding protein